jgi:quinol monooxygenase YgiN
MSVLMTLRVKGDPKKLEAYSAANSDQLRSFAEAAKSYGMTAHRFYGQEGEIMVVDEWPDEQSFQAFFSEKGGEIGEMFQAAGVSEEPRPEFWHVLESADKVGWGA